MLEAFFKTDEGLDYITKWKKEHPGETFFYDEMMKTLKEDIRSALATLIECQKEGLKQINKDVSKEIFKGKTFCNNAIIKQTTSHFITCPVKEPGTKFN